MEILEDPRRPYEAPVLLKREQLPIIVAGASAPADDDTDDDTDNGS
jgi:hypothetical protein